MKFDLSISTAYLPDWTAADGIRELVQNAVDCQTAHGHKMKITHLPRSGKLVLANVGARLDRKALLFGHTSKRGDDSQIGQFGEGLKLGILALVRAGHRVVIRSGLDVWKPTLRPSEAYNSEVLSFDIQTSRVCRDEVSVEIANIASTFWAETQERFTFLRPPQGESFSFNRNTLYKDASAAGKVFAKGIYVCTKAELQYGYDFANLKVDRDRRMAETYALQEATAAVLASVANRNPDFLSDLYMLLETDKEDIKGLWGWRLDWATKAALAGIFSEKHGTDAFPVANEGQRQDLAFYGRTGVVLHPNLVDILHQAMGNLDSYLKKVAACVVKTYTESDLTNEEDENLLRAKLLCRSFAFKGEDLPPVEISDFTDAKLRGVWDPERQTVTLARRILTNKADTLLVLIHEFAHASSNAGDGEPKFVARLSEAWSDLVSKGTSL